MNKQIIGEKIKIARTAKGYTQAQLAEIVSMHEKHISRIESGKSLPALENLVKIFKALDIELNSNDIEAKIPVNNTSAKIEFLKFLNNLTENEMEFYLGVVKQIQKGLFKLSN